MINGTFLAQQARFLAGPPPPRGRRRRGWAGRRGPPPGHGRGLPGDAEVVRGVALIVGVPGPRTTLDDDAMALRAFCLAVLNLNEFIYLD